MESRVRVVLDMALRVRDFLRTNPIGGDHADPVLVRFEERVARALTLMAEHREEVVAAGAARARRDGLRQAIRRTLIGPVAKIARAAATPPHLAEQLQRGPANRSAQEFRAWAGTVAALVTQERTLLGAHGMAERLPDDLADRLALYDAAASQTNESVLTHVGARAELRMLASVLIQLVRQLEGVVEYRFRDNPEVLAEWASARNVVRRTRTAQTEPTPSQPGGTEEPAA